ncbi:MAG: hypothetical protein N2691_03770 [Patescibacteria group bacterium]|nr:hypothetical protein [Patescibacteria group bacterium]
MASYYGYKLTGIPREVGQYFGPDIKPESHSKLPALTAYLFVRDRNFDRWGTMVSAIDERGGHSLGEIQRVLQLFKESCTYDPNTQCIQADGGYAGVLMKAAMAAGHSYDNAARLVRDYAIDISFYRIACQWAAENPDIVSTVVDQPDFHQLKAAFTETRLGAEIAPDSEVGIAMIANYLLDCFQKVGGSEQGNQLLLTNEFRDGITKVLNDHEINVLFQEGTDKLTILHEMAVTLINVPAWTARVDGKAHDIATREALDSFTELERQIAYHAHEVNVMRAIKSPRVIIDPRRSLYSNFIGNIALTKTNEGKPEYTASRSYFPRSAGYLGTDTDPLPSFTPLSGECPPSTTDMAGIIKQIFNGQIDEADIPPLHNQIRKIHEFAPQIIGFLTGHPAVPETVREIVATLADKASFRQKAARLLGPVSDNDINVVNRFNQTVEEAYRNAVFKIVFDFVRGVETMVILQNRSLHERLKHQFSGRWENTNLGDVSDVGLTDAIYRVLEDGDHRVKMLNQDPDEIKYKKRWTLKDYQERFIEYALWDSHETKFMRWKPRHDVYNSAVGTAWECACFRRVQFFDVHKFQTS